MTFHINPDLIENNDVQLTTDANGDLAIEHKPSGNILTVDETDSLSGKANNPLEGALDASSQDITNAGAVGADSATVTNGVTAGSVDADHARLTNQNVVYAHGANGNYSEPFPIADYADGGAAIQAALDALSTSGGTVRLPAGRLTVSSTITVPSGDGTVVHVTGHGTKHDTNDGGTILDSSIGDGSHVLTMGSSTSPARGNVLKDFSIEGSGSDGVGLFAKHWYQNGYASNVGVYGMGAHGFRFNDCWSQAFIRLRARNNGGEGFFLDGSNGSTFLECHAHNNSGNGFYSQNHSSGAGYIGCDSEDNGQSGFSSDSSDANACLINPHAELNAHGIQIKGNSAAIVGGKTSNNSNNGILVNGASEVNIQGMALTESGTHIKLSNGCSNVALGAIGLNGGGTLIDSGATGSAIDVTAPHETAFNSGSASDGDSDNAISITFDCAFTSRPKLSFGRVGGGITGVSFTTNANGNYDGATVNVSTAGGTIDWKAEP